MIFVSRTFLRKFREDRDNDNKIACLAGCNVEATNRSQSESKEKKAMLFARKKRTFYRVKKTFSLNKKKFKSINFYQLIFSLLA
jgi:hypothetical protein